MLSSNKIILETLAVLREHGVVNYVLCPGSRNAGIVHSICQIEDFYTYTATDERSAGFMAIGIALATNLPTAVVVTSGSALANLYPAACEAYYQRIPLVFISADRPAAWINQMDGQTMPQPNALGQMVKMSVNLPSDNLWHANRLLNEVCISSYRRMPRGPVHINIPLEEPIYDFSATALPEARIIRYADFDTIDMSRKEYKCYIEPFHGGNTLIVIGQLSENETPHPQKLARIAQKFNIIAENLSNLPLNLYRNASSVDWSKLEGINRVITLGGHIINKELKQYLRQRHLKEHWHVSEDGAIADLFCQQTMAIKASIDNFLDVFYTYTTTEIWPNPLPQKEQKAEDGRIDILNRLYQLLPPKAALVLANSSSVRLAQLANNRPCESTLCNRGINGIEGTLSTAVGYAMVRTDQPVFVIIGDLAFFYDQNALWQKSHPKNLHILLFNDGGGSIFNTLPLPSEAPHSIEAITGKHTLSAKHVAQLHGIRYMQGTENLEEFINTQETIILEII